MIRHRIVFNNGMERIILARGFRYTCENSMLGFENGIGEYWFWAPVKSVAYVEIINE